MYKISCFSLLDWHLTFFSQFFVALRQSYLSKAFFGSVCHPSHVNLVSLTLHSNPSKTSRLNEDKAYSKQNQEHATLSSSSLSSSCLYSSSSSPSTSISDGSFPPSFPTISSKLFNENDGEGGDEGPAEGEGAIEKGLRVRLGKAGEKAAEVMLRAGE